MLQEYCAFLSVRCERFLDCSLFADKESSLENTISNLMRLKKFLSTSSCLCNLGDLKANLSNFVLKLKVSIFRNICRIFGFALAQ